MAVLARCLLGCALGLLWLSAPAAAQTVHPNALAPEPVLSVVATGTSDVAPDVAVVTLGTFASANTAPDAMRAMSRNMTAMIDALTATGVDARDMQTSGITLYPAQDVRTVDQGGGVQSQEMYVREYVASNTLSVRVRELDELGGLLDRMVSVGSNTIQSIEFALDDPLAAEDAARQAAMADALKQAELYATASGHRTGRIVSLVEQASDLTSPYDMPQSVGAELDQAFKATPVAGGEVTYSVTLNVTFELVK